MKKRRSIASSILFWMILVAITPLLIMSFQGYHCARQAVLQLKQDHLESISEAKRRSIMTWLDERTRELRNHTMRADETACSCGAEELLHVNPAYESITLYSNNWDRISYVGAENHNDEKLLPPAFQQALEAGEATVVSQPHLHGNGLIGIHIGVSVPQYNRYAVAVLDLSSTLYPLLAEPLSTDQNIHSFIATSDGKLLSSQTYRSQNVDTKINLPEMYKGVSRLTPYTGLSGESVVGASLRLDPFGWILVSETPTRDAFAWISILRERAAKTGLVSLVIVVLFAGQSARRLTRPLRHMAEVALRISEGHYTTRMKHFSGREHAEVAEAFNRMLDEIDRTQAKLAQAAALSAIGALSASIVHEMRNPLAAIKMNIEVLQHATQDDPIHRELGEIASEQVLRLEVMLEDLLQYGRKLELKKTAVPVTNFMQEIETCIRRGNEQKVAFTFHNAGQIDTLPIDHEQMLRAVSNLVDNAIQASPDESSVALTLKRSSSKELLIEVSDRGSGIPERIAEKLFEPFFTTKKKGTGLGLANVKKIVELHGGCIDFRNTNPGATFTITLPNEGNQT